MINDQDNHACYYLAKAQTCFLLFFGYIYIYFAIFVLDDNSKKVFLLNIFLCFLHRYNKNEIFVLGFIFFFIIIIIRLALCTSRFFLFITIKALVVINEV